MNSQILKQAVLGLALMTGVPLRSQVSPAPESGSNPPSDNMPAAPVQETVTETTEAPLPALADDRMQTPPPISGAAYPTVPLAAQRSNYLRGGLTFTTAYSDNVLGSISAAPVSDISYSIFPNIALDQTTGRMHFLLSYSPGFTFYQRVSSRNQQNQNVGVNFSYRLSPHVTLSLHDSFQKSSSVLDQPGLASSGSVNGGTQGVPVNVIAPLADQLNNNGDAELTYQFSLSDMVGVSGTFSNLHYPDPQQVTGLYDSSSQGASAFYNHRLSKKHYLGASYQFQRILSYPPNAQSDTQTQAVMVFYTVYLQQHLSVSLSGGPQHSNVSQAPLPSSQQWSPAVSASVGWQGRRVTFAASYSRVVSGGGGLVGAFHSNSANLNSHQQLTRNWNLNENGSYSINKTVTPFAFFSTPGGHSISGSAAVQRRVGQHFGVEAGYTRLHQSYSNIGAVSQAPDTNREYISISYEFARPLGR